MAFPAGPWVLVVGMHRSGTSAITGALSQLQVQLPDTADLMHGKRDNPAHYESVALTEITNSMIKKLGRSWSSPPRLEGDWAARFSLDGFVARAEAATWVAFPHRGPVLWKDPRLCLLLPFWRQVLPGPLNVLFIWRSPLAVARSLRHRNHFRLSKGLALWNRYNRDALRALTGMSVLVLQYEEAVADPHAVCAEAADWLDGRLGPTASPRRDGVLAAAATVSPSLCHQRGTGQVSGYYSDLVDVLTRLRGTHQRFEPPVLGPAWD